MKITHIEAIPVSVPIIPKLAIRSSLGAHTHSPFLLLEVRTNEGLTGFGEVSCTPGWSGEDHVTAFHIVRNFIAPALLGANPLDIENAIAVMRKAVAANPFTKAGVEMALWDLLGKAANLPLYRLWGGAVRDVVPLKFSISGAEPEKAAELAQWALDTGFKTMKVKVALGDDFNRVRRIRETIGENIRLGVDANGGWTPSEAVQGIRKLMPFHVYFAEQPVAPVDMSWMAEVRRQIEIPVMADESLYTLYDAMALVRSSAADVFSIYVGKAGLSSARKVAALAEAAGLTCTIGSNMELGVASAAMIHLAMATPGIGAEQYPCDILSHLFYDTNLLTEPLPVCGAEARAPQKPGLGVELDSASIKHHRVDL